MQTAVNVVHVQSVVSVLMLVGVLVASTLFQQRATKQYRRLLDEMAPRVKSTEIFLSAERYFKRRECENVFTSGPHALPVWLLIFVVTACSIGTYFGAVFYGEKGVDPVPSFVLGGAYAIDPAGAIENLHRYQAGTAFIGSMAFLGAYLWVIGQVVNRIDNNDMNPSTYYFLSIRILTACLVAALARHIIEGIPLLRGFVYSEGGKDAEFPVGLAIFGFLIGWNPALWIQETLLRIGDLIKTQIPSQRWPQKQDLPLNLTLLMLQGMVPDKIDRMNELDIENCQKMASENPIILWIRTAYTLELILDWISQAQLAIRFEGDTFYKLRAVGIRDIFSYGAAISNEQSLDAISEKIGVPKSILLSHASSMLTCPACGRLKALRMALLPEATNKSVGQLNEKDCDSAGCCG
ncbi:MAG: hypothetical protein Q7V20_21820 [Aquabacterium sp.]|uniref:hypothetical protein n=1 Tax=Aquabacterium sp. TaxID=1872578 RepID=UPI00271E4031|nr:hypothetical protein [Aquabacterium sp.]MDO9006091.1 hypothetical protein [Aquabacterium sp.]